MPLVAELGEGFFLEGGDLRLIHGELRLAFTGFRRAFTGLPARHQSPTQVDAPGPGNCAHDKALIGHVPRCEQAGDGGVAAEGLQREARAATGGTHEPRDPLHRFREGVDALACAGFKEHGEHPPAQILVFFTHPPEVKRDGPASGPHSCVMARTRMCSMAPSPCTGSYLCIKVSPRALVKRPPRHWKRLMPQMSKSLAVAL